MRISRIVAALLALAAASYVHAQETTTGSIAGQVVDAQGAPVPGATVSVTSDQGTRTFVTDQDGRFYAAFLTPGRYQVRVELSGFAPIQRQDVDVRLGQRVELPDLQLRVGSLTETVEVVGAAPTIDTSSTTVGGTLDSDALTRLPVGRQLADTLYLVPGVSSSGQVGQQNPSVSGASGLENQYIVDGVNITNTGYGALGSYSIVFGSLGNGVTTDFIQETQVRTAGFEAEWGQSTGGIVNVITRSGTNDWRGSVYGYFRPNGLERSYKQIDLVDPTGPDPAVVNTQGTDVSDVGLTVGGPLIRDRLFVFAAFNPQWQTQTVVAPEDFPLARLGEVDRDRRILSYAGKLTWQASSAHRFDASFFGDPAHGEMGPQRLTALFRETETGFSEIDYGGHNQVLRYDGILSPNWLVEASVAHAYNAIEETPGTDEWVVTNQLQSPARITGGIGFYEVGNKGHNTQFQLKSTNIVEWGGHHQIRYGGLYEDVNYDNIIQRTGPTFTLANGVQTTTGAEIVVLPDPNFGQIFRVVRANTGNVRDTDQRYLALFLQDTWEVTDRLTLLPGIRYEEQRLVGNLADHTWDGNWAPRIGATFDPTGSGRGKLFANWGRFYARIPNDLAARALSADAGVTRADYFDAGLTRPIPEGTPTGGVEGNPFTTDHLLEAGLSPAEIDPDSRSTYQDEFLGGVEWELFRDVRVGARYIFRTMPRVLEDVGTAAMLLYFTREDLPSVEYFITNPRDGFPPTVEGIGAFEDPVHRYHAVELTAQRAYRDNWSLFASYRWSRLRGNFEGFFRNDNGQSDPAITSLYDFPTNDPTYASPEGRALGFLGDIRFLGAAGIGPLPNDRTHQFKLYGNRTFGRLTLGLGAIAGSGRPLTAFAANPVYDSNGEIPLAPRGSGIETEDGFRTRGPVEVAVDVHADYTFRLGGDRRVIVLADAFNLFNRQSALNFDQNVETGFGRPDPDFGRIIQFTNPTRVRLGARFEW